MSTLLEKLKSTSKENRRISDVFEIIDGDRGSNYPSKTEFTKFGYCVFLNTKNVPSEGFDLNDVDFISQKRDELLRKGKLLRNDIVMTTRGTIGNVALYSKSVPFDCMRINSGMVLLRVKKQFDLNYLYILIKSAFFNARLKNMASGSAQPQLPIKDIKEIELNLPDLPAQKKIAEILGAYDAKIENNNLIIKNLEATAQAIFNEWFVKFRFPRSTSSGQAGHEKMKMVGSELGLIPERWRARKVSDVATLNKGVSYSSPEISDKPMGLPLINLKCFTRGGGFKVEGMKYYSGEFRKKHEVVPGQIVIALTDLTPTREVIGRPARVPIIAGFNKILISLDVCSVQTKEETKEAHEFLYYMLRRREFGELMALSASGTTVAHLSAFNIENYEFIFPPKELIQKFHSFIKETFSLQGDLSDQNKNLRTSRDQLLKKLI